LSRTAKPDEHKSNNAAAKQLQIQLLRYLDTRTCYFQMQTKRASITGWQFIEA